VLLHFGRISLDFCPVTLLISDMDRKILETAQEILDTMLGYLGFVVTIDVDEVTGPEPFLQVASNDSDALIGKDGERLDEIQYLVNRLVQMRYPDARRVRIDIDHYRATSEMQMLEQADTVAERVAASGAPFKLEPMNSYHRRLIHTHFKNHPTVVTTSPRDDARLKRITIAPKK